MSDLLGELIFRMLGGGPQADWVSNGESGWVLVSLQESMAELRWSQGARGLRGTEAQDARLEVTRSAGARRLERKTELTRMRSTMWRLAPYAGLPWRSSREF